MDKEAQLAKTRAEMAAGAARVRANTPAAKIAEWKKAGKITVVHYADGNFIEVGGVRVAPYHDGQLSEEILAKVAIALLGASL